MNGLNNSGDEVVECPLCMEPLEVDDLNFYPCTCGYQICRFCWHRIRTDENELCPACRKEYPENPADFTPLTQEEILAFKSQKRQRDQQRKQKITENRKHLSNVRVVQKNLVFVVGLPPRLADAEILKKHEYFGKYGKIHKVVINPSTTYAGVQGPSASAYVTYVHNNDALRAIQSVNNVMIDGRLIKTSLGTTKYCSHFMKNQQCPKGDCMYLHELGDPEASFTKEEMHQGKHQEYEKRLHDALIAISGASSVGGIGHSNSSTSASTLGNGAMSSSISSSSSVSTVAPNGTATTAAMSAAGVQQKEAWPSLSVSPVNTKESISTSGKTKKEKSKPEKSKNDKSSRTKNKNSSSYNSTNNTANTTSKENSHGNVLKEVSMTLPGEATTVFVASEQNSVSANANNGNGGKLKNDKGKDKALSNRNRGLYHNDEQHSVSKEKRTISADEEVKLIEGLEKQVNDYKGDSNAVSNSTSTASVNKGHFEQSGVNKIEDQRSFSSSSNRSGSSNNSNSSTNNSDLLSLSESASGKSSPGSFPDCNSSSEKLAMKSDKAETDTLNSLSGNLSSQQLNVAISRESINNGNCELTATSSTLNNSNIQNETGVNIAKDNSNDHSEEIASKSADMNLPVSSDSDLQDTRVAFSKMNLFDDNNSFFSSGTSFQQSLLSKNKVGIESRQNQANSAISSHLPDLLKGIDEYPSNSVVNDFPNLGGHCHGSTDLNRFPQVALLQPQHQTQHQMGHPAEHLMSSNMFDANMSKFFNFHKNQQQQLHQHFLINGHTGGSGNNALSDHLRAVSLLENNRINYQFLDQSNGLLATQQQQQQIQKQRTLGKFDPMVNLPQNVLSDYILNSIVTQQLALQQQHQQSQSHPHSHQQPKQPGHLQGQYLQNACVDDDLGFDPFIETQKGLAELMENEVAQHQNANVNRNDTTTIATKILQHQQQQQQQNLLDNIQRTRMPPPGFNHMNAFGFGVPRTQSSSKILPFVNMSGNGPVNGAQTQQQHMQAPNSWNPHLAAFQTQQQTLNDSQTHSIALNQNNANHSKGYSNNDWTAMDPAILSFRQFSSFPPQTQMPHHLQSQDIYMPHLTQQQSSQNYATQSQLHGGTNLPSSILNSQPASQAQVNANVQGMLEYLKTRQFV